MRVFVCVWLVGVRVIIFAQRNALKTKVELEGLQRKKERVRNRKVASAEGQSRGKRVRSVNLSDANNIQSTLHFLA